MGVAGLDIGGTTTRVAVLLEGVRTVRTFATETDSPDTLASHIVRVLSETARSAGVEAKDLSAIGIALPGTVDQAAGSVRLATNLGIGADAFALGTIVSQSIETDVIVENDVKAAALGLAGDLPDPKNSILTYVSVGTGIASATVINGNVVRGAHGSAGEIGQIRIQQDGPSLNGAVDGSLEALASGRALADETLGATREDRLAASIDNLAVGVHMLWMTFDPNDVVIGGGVSLNDGFEKSLRTALEARRHCSSVTASIIDLDNLRVLPADAMPGIEGALHLASQIPEGSGRATYPAQTGGNTA